MNVLKDSSIAQQKITRVAGHTVEETMDFLAVEEPFEISITALKAQPSVFNKNISITMRTPGHDEDLALGFLFTEGLISDRKQVDQVILAENKVNVFLNDSQSLDLSQMERHFYTSSSCGVCGKASIDAIKTVCKIEVAPVKLTLDAELIKTLPQVLRAHQEVFESTGGLHAAVLFDTRGNLIALREDVGRHNALDKLIGNRFKNEELPLNKQLLLLSGRASFELIQKASMAGIQVVMAVGAPSSLAVELAKEFGMTLIGFLNKERFNIYCGAERVSV